MTLVEDYGLDSPPRTLLLLVLSINDCNHAKEMDKLHIHKVIRFFEHLRKKKEIDFSNFKLGGVSYELEENKDALIEYELIEPKDGCFALTDEGNEAAKVLKQTFDTNDYGELVFAKQLLNDLPGDELLYYMYMMIPETQKHSTEFSRLERKKEALVKSLFLKRKIDVATSSMWLGISQSDFVKKFPKRAISADMQKALIESYQKSSDEDLAIVKDFEQVDKELGQECDL
jgi:hypothetical protein